MMVYYVYIQYTFYRFFLYLPVQLIKYGRVSIYIYSILWYKHYRCIIIILFYIVIYYLDLNIYHVKIKCKFSYIFFQIYIAFYILYTVYWL